MAVTFDWRENLKQKLLLAIVLAELRGGELAEGFRWIFFGGGIRGGKTFGMMAILCILCRLFPGSRWAIIRKNSTRLKSTTIPSFEKLVQGGKGKWHKRDNDFYYEFNNAIGRGIGSRVYFISENLERDPLLTAFDGYEVNGFLLEQIEEISERTFEKCKERAGSWYTRDKYGKANTPPAFIFSTFNPTSTWVKSKVYEVWKKGLLKTPYYFIEALAEDNPFVTADQNRAWEGLNSRDYKRMIKGNWEFDAEGQFIWSFNKEKHVDITDEWFDPNLFIGVSLDFNVDPMCGIIYETDGKSYLRIVDEMRLHNVGVPDVNIHLDAYFKEHGIDSNDVYWTGDAKGNDRNRGMIGAISEWRQIRNYFNTTDEKHMIPTVNPFLDQSWRFCNTVMEKLDIVVNKRCKYTIRDLEYSLKGEDSKGKIKKLEKGVNPFCGIDNKDLWHTLDTVRYCFHSWFHNSVFMYES